MLGAHIFLSTSPDRAAKAEVPHREKVGIRPLRALAVLGQLRAGTCGRGGRDGQSQSPAQSRVLEPLTFAGWEGASEEVVGDIGECQEVVRVPEDVPGSFRLQHLQDHGWS